MQFLILTGDDTRQLLWLIMAQLHWASVVSYPLHPRNGANFNMLTDDNNLTLCLLSFSPPLCPLPCRRQSIATGGLGTGDSAPDFRQVRCTPDWSENAVAGDHLWSPTSVSVDFCYVGDGDCVVSGDRNLYFRKLWKK